jgi:hypothetical protein
MPLPTKTDADLLADELDRRGLSAPAALLIDAHRPLIPLMRQGAIFAGPLLGSLFGRGRVASLLRHLEEPDAIDRLLARLRNGGGERRARP